MKDNNRLEKIFRKRLLLNIRPFHNSVYGIYNPKSISYLTQSRVGVNKLNYHKFKHNFADTVSPMCLANEGIEDTEHFLLLCHSFDNNRGSLLSGVNEIFKAVGNIVGPNQSLLQNLLYGVKNLSDDANKQILDLTIKYILETKGFDQ